MVGAINLVANSGVQARLRVEVKQVTREQRQAEANGLVETIAMSGLLRAQRRMPFMLLLSRPPRFRFTVLRLLFGSGDRRSRGAVYVLLRCRRVCPCAVGGVVLPG